MSARPCVVIPARFSATASALRYRATVTAQALAEAVFAAGGEPLTVLPNAEDPARRFSFADAILLPGGGDLAPSTYGQLSDSSELYDVDAAQDLADLALARWACSTDQPLLAVCRGMQVLNVALGGTLEQHMASPHRHTIRRISIDQSSQTAAWFGNRDVEISCFHHQRVSTLAAPLRVVARAADGTVEALEFKDRRAFGFAVQWHPEDNYLDDADNESIFAALVDAAAAHRHRPAQRSAADSDV